MTETGSDDPNTRKEKNISLGLVNWTLWKRTKMKQETQFKDR